MGKTRGTLSCRTTKKVLEDKQGHEDVSLASTSGREHLEQCYAVSSSTGTQQRYMCYFLHRLLNFRLPELTALADMYGVKDVHWELPHCGNEVSPFWYVHLPNERIAHKIVERAVLLRGIMEVWGEGSTFDELAAAVTAYPDHLKAPHLGPDTSFRIMLDAWGFAWTDQQQNELLRKLEFIPFQGKVDLKTPQHVFWLCCQDKKDEHNGLPEMPTRWYFCRQIALVDRSWVKEYALPKRAYIGPTSMDPEMAFLMTNMAQVDRHNLVLDPYVGTGSILIAAAARGAHTLGADIDVRVIKHGKQCPKTGKTLDIYSNYDQYGLQYPVGLIRMDVHTHPFRDGLREVFNAILGDPPYGVRAGGRKSVAKDVTVRYRATHIPSTEPYSLTECLIDLLELAAQTLVLGGRLVFFMPATPDTYRQDQLPIHPMLQLIDDTEQLLTTRYSRRLVTMRKVRSYDAAEAATFMAERADFVMDIDRIHEIVYAQDGKKYGLTVADGDNITKAVRPKYRSKMC